MPKTKDAFAFRDFDTERILQRPFFKIFHFATDKSDEEILATLSATDFDSFETTQIKLADLDMLLARAAEYQRHMKRHGDRLTKYARAVERKITIDETADISALRKRHERAGQLSMKYCGCVTASGITSYSIFGIAIHDIGGLCDKISERYKELDGKEKAHYRKIFAERLKSIRKEMKWTQAELALRLGLTQRGISNFENAIYEPSLAILVKISKLLKRPVGWFLGAN